MAVIHSYPDGSESSHSETVFALAACSRCRPDLAIVLRDVLDDCSGVPHGCCGHCDDAREAAPSVRGGVAFTAAASVPPVDKFRPHLDDPDGGRRAD